MTVEEIYARLNTVFEDVFDEDIIVTPELSAADVPDWDSLKHVRLILSVEKAFHIRFAASEVGNMKNVEDLVHLIEQKSDSSQH